MLNRNEQFSHNKSEGYQFYDESHEQNNEGFSNNYENNDNFAKMLVKSNPNQSLLNQMYPENLDRNEGEYYSDEGEEEEFEITDQQTFEDKYFSSNISDIYSSQASINMKR